MIEAKEIKTSIPGYRPSGEERETIITFNETGEPASVYTFNPALIRKLDALEEERPEDVTCIKAESINGVQLREYEVPKAWIKVRASRILTEEQKAVLSERGKRNAVNLKNHREASAERPYTAN